MFIEMNLTKSITKSKFLIYFHRSDIDTSLIIYQKSRVKTGSEMIKRAKKKELIMSLDNKKPTEVRVIAK